MTRSWTFAHRRFIVCTVLILALAGIALSGEMPVSLFPNTEFPRVVVDVDAGDRPAEQMALEVTSLLEQTVRLVPGVLSVRSETGRGIASVSISFAWGEDMARAVLQVQAAISQALPQFPAGAAFDVRHMAPELTPVFSYSITSERRPSSELQDIGRFQLGPLLTPVSGVLRVEVLGGETEEFTVDVEPAKLNAFDVTLAEVSAAISANNVLSATGRLEDHYKLYLVMADSRLKGDDDLREVVVKNLAGRPVRVRDVAAVTRGTAPSWTRVTADGRPAVLVNVYQRPGGNTAKIAKEAQAKVDELAAILPGDVKLANWYDQSELVLASVGSVRDAIMIGVLLAAFVLFGFLRNWRITIISLVIVPTVLAISVLVMHILGMGFNIMTLGGMAAAVGLVIDDAIVLLEHIARRLEARAGIDGKSVVQAAAREFTRPLLGSSLATLVILIPPTFLTGATGAFFKALSLTMAICLIVSFAVCWLVIPIMAERLLSHIGNHSSPQEGRIATFIKRRYAAVLALWLRKPILPFLTVGLLVAAGVFAFFRVGTGFMPEMDEGGFILDYVAPPGTSLTETDRLVRQIEGVLAKVPEVQTYSRRTGLGMGGGFHPTNEGDFFVRLKSLPRRGIDEVMAEVRHTVKAEVPGLDTEVLQLMEDLIGDLTAVPQPVEVKLFADDGELLGEVATKVAKALEAVPGIVDIKAGASPAGDALVYHLDLRKTTAEGVDADSVSKTVSGALAGIVSSYIQSGPKMIGVRVELPPRLRQSEDTLKSIRVKGTDGHLLPLRRIASVETVASQPVIARENLKRMIAVTARLSNRDLGNAMADVKKVLANADLLPKGVYFGLGGVYAEQQRAFHELELVMVAGAILVFLTLLLLYESIAVAVSCVAMPALAMPAVYIGLWLTDTPLNISSMMGLTMIIGIVTEVGIFYFSEVLASGPSDHIDHSSLVEAGVSRLRPIAMTSLAAILTLMPLALGLGEGAEMQQPLAIATIAGLAIQLPLVLLVMPVLYSGLVEIKRRVKNRLIGIGIPSVAEASLEPLDLLG